MRGVNQVLNVLLTVVGVLVAVTILSLAVLPRVLNYRTYVVRSGSMAPAIPTGALVFAAVTPPEDLRIGDVITFVRPTDQENVTHRIVAIDNTAQGLTFVTKGDANASNDLSQVHYSAMAGKVVLSIPDVGYVLGGLSSPNTRFALIVVPGLLLLGMWLWEIWKPQQDLRPREVELMGGMKPDPLRPAAPTPSTEIDTSPDAAATLPNRS